MSSSGKPLDTTLLMDGDVFTYMVASAVQKVEEDGFGYLRPFANIAEGEAALDNMILKLCDSLKATHLRMVLSDPESNWRMEIAPDYKANRTDLARPLLLARLKEYLRVVYGAFHWAGLEADDTLGILATEEVGYAGRRIVVGRDKDFLSIPGLHHTIGDVDASGSPIVREVTRAAADRFHMVQALAGDRIDGYAGCPGIGMTRAERIIDDPKLLVPQKGIVTRGPRKGEETTKWVGEPTADIWQCVVSHYRKEGLTEEDAIRTARLARILRAEDYDQDKGRIILWTPDKIVR